MDIQDILLKIILGGLFINGLHMVAYYLHAHWSNTDFDDIIAKLNRRDASKGDFIKLTLFKPLIGCNVCMSNPWGISSYFVLFDTFEIFTFVAYILGTAGFSTIVNRI